MGVSEFDVFTRYRKAMRKKGPHADQIYNRVKEMLKKGSPEKPDH